MEKFIIIDRFTDKMQYRHLGIINKPLVPLDLCNYLNIIKKGINSENVKIVNLKQLFPKGNKFFYDLLKSKFIYAESESESQNNFFSNMKNTNEKVRCYLTGKGEYN